MVTAGGGRDDDSVPVSGTSCRSVCSALVDDQSVDIQRVTVALPGDVAQAADSLAAMTGAGPGLRDGDDWVQADLPGTGVRLAVSGPAGGVTEPTVLLKVAELTAARDSLVAAGLAVGDVEQGGHEMRCTLTLPGVSSMAIVIYQPS